MRWKKTIKTIVKRLPNVIKNINSARDILIEKYTSDIIKNITDFRKLSKLATSIKAFGFDENTATKNIEKLLQDNSISIDSIYTSTVAHLYDEKKFLDNAQNILLYIENLDDADIEDEDIREMLVKIRETLNKIL